MMNTKGLFLYSLIKEKKRKKFKQLLADRRDNLKILVIRDGLIGDVIFITPMLMRLHTFLPSAQIDIVVSKNSFEVLQNFPGLKNIYVLENNKSLIKQIIFFLGFRKIKYDLCLNQEVNSHYTFMSKLVGAKFLLGFENKAGYLLDYVAERKGHAVIAEQGIINGWIENIQEVATQLFVSETGENNAKQELNSLGISENDFVICFQIGCSEDNSVRQWIGERYAQTADYLVEHYGIKIIYTGIDRDKNEIETVRKIMKHNSVSLAGKTTVRELIAVIKRTKLVVGPDTGTLHIANALSIPVVMLVGWADPADTGPYDITGNSKTISASLDCIPCKFKNPKPDQWNICKRQRPALCMELISTDLVITAINEILIKKYYFEKNNYGILFNKNMVSP